MKWVRKLNIHRGYQILHLILNRICFRWDKNFCTDEHIQSCTEELHLLLPFRLFFSMVWRLNKRLYWTGVGRTDVPGHHSCCLGHFNTLCEFDYLELVRVCIYLIRLGVEPKAGFICHCCHFDKELTESALTPQLLWKSGESLFRGRLWAFLMFLSLSGQKWASAWVPMYLDGLMSFYICQGLSSVLCTAHSAFWAAPNIVYKWPRKKTTFSRLLFFVFFFHKWKCEPKMMMPCLLSTYWFFLILRWFSNRGWFLQRCKSICLRDWNIKNALFLLKIPNNKERLIDYLLLE